MSAYKKHGTITLTRAEFEVVKITLERSLDCGYSNYDRDKALAILSKHEVKDDGDPEPPSSDDDLVEKKI